MPTVFCSHCGKKMRAPESAVGKRGLCPTCGTLVEIANTSAGAIAASGSETQPNEDRVGADAGAPNSRPPDASSQTTTSKAVSEDEQSKVERLAALYKQGALNKEEFETLKKQAFQERTPSARTTANSEVCSPAGAASDVHGQSMIAQTWTRLSVIERRVAGGAIVFLVLAAGFLTVSKWRSGGTVNGPTIERKARIHGKVKYRTTGGAWEGCSLLVCRRYASDGGKTIDLLRLSEEFTEEFRECGQALSRSFSEAAGSLRAGNRIEANAAISEGALALQARKSKLGAMQRMLDLSIAAATVARLSSGREGTYEVCNVDQGEYVVGHPVELPLLVDKASDRGRTALCLMGAKAVAVENADVRLDMDSLDE